MTTEAQGNVGYGRPDDMKQEVHGRLHCRHPDKVLVRLVSRPFLALVSTDIRAILHAPTPLMSTDLMHASVDDMSRRVTRRRCSDEKGKKKDVSLTA